MIISIHADARRKANKTEEKGNEKTVKEDEKNSEEEGEKKNSIKGR